MDHEANPSEIVAEGAAYMAFQQENPDLANQIVVKQVDNESQPTQKNVPILFGYESRKWRDTIFGIDRDTFEIKRFKDHQIDLYLCNLV